MNKLEKTRATDTNFGSRLCVLDDEAAIESLYHTAGRRVLIVDDDSFSRKKVRKAAEHAGFHVVGELDDGSRAVQYFNLFMPDLIIMDVMMNNMDGLSAAKRIFMRNRDVRIIMMSSMDKPEMVGACMHAGVSDYLKKPFGDDLLITSMKLALTPRGRNASHPEACAAFAADARGSAGPKILLVDDEDFMRKKLRNVIESNMKARIFEVSDGSEAVHAVEWLQPRLVMLDIMMKHMNGVHAAPRIRAVSPESQIIMVSGIRNPEMIKNCVFLGASGYIMKPFEPHDVMATVNRALEKQEH